MRLNHSFEPGFTTGRRTLNLGPCRRSRRELTVALAAQAVLPASLFASEIIRPTLDVQDMRVVVSYVSTGELVLLQAKYGANIDRRDIRQDYRHGFSILKTNRETGARTCEVYLPNAQRARKVDDEGTLTLGHELLHCMLGNYHP
jgi:hypothetical protein